MWIGSPSKDNWQDLRAWTLLVTRVPWLDIRDLESKGMSLQVARWPSSQGVRLSAH